ncbi:hypothetical protein DWB84_03435 [Saccharophagus sp. K07]|uniref:hypothetical protein n=1 Tax=Saccharophagus sp. K07 TaxID=2283636 RepID=UPI001652720F|nr:hypothetical protein [Saccharophagus sp. K07]MBC6904518.1 hypothetical protein [Saccharophagus sp. K07]
MPLDSIVEGFFGGLWRAVLWVVVEIVFELLIKGLGYTICRPFGKVDIDNGRCALVGILAWVILIWALLYFLI